MRCGNCQEVVFWTVFSSSARSNQISLAIEHIIEMYKLELLSVCILLFSFFVFCFVVCLDRQQIVSMMIMTLEMPLSHSKDNFI